MQQPPAALASYLEAKGIKQVEFARKAGIQESMLSHYLRGERRPGLKTARNIEVASGGAVPANSWIDFEPTSRTQRRSSKAA